ncbi:hypothetical protein [Nitrospira moscoviensis]|nr:hypothetical protein [Nitrospira moscoviensis]
MNGRFSALLLGLLLAAAPPALAPHGAAAAESVDRRGGTMDRRDITLLVIEASRLRTALLNRIKATADQKADDPDLIPLQQVLLRLQIAEENVELSLGRLDTMPERVDDPHALPQAVETLKEAIDDAQAFAQAENEGR